MTPLPGTPMRNPLPRNQQSGQSMLQCEVCYVMFKNVKTLNTHVKQEHTDQKFVLNKKVTSAGVQVDGHDANVSIENESTNSSQSNVTPQKNCATYVCNVCKITVDTFIELQSHQKKDHPLHPYMCDIKTCGSMYKTRGGLKKHLVKHDIASPIKCNTCQVIFSSVEKKTEHKCLQSEINKFHCDFVCGYTTNKTYDKQRHESTCHNNPKRQITCHMCGVVCYGEEELAVHNSEKHLSVLLNGQKRPS